MDIITSEGRSRLMAKIRGKDTRPEMVVRRLVHGLGYRYRLHRKDLPGSPDLVFPGRRKAIFVHGCFWHRHPGCKLAYMPSTRRNFWKSKFENNIERDRKSVKALEELGWDILLVWECETRNPDSLPEKLTKFLEQNPS